MHSRTERTSLLLKRGGRAIALAGIVLPLLFMAWLELTPARLEALAFLASHTPWLAWFNRSFGTTSVSNAIGIFHFVTALLLLASPWSARAGLAGGAMAVATFLIMSSMLFGQVPVWDYRVGGFPALSPLGQCLIKDIALLGIALVVAGESLLRRRGITSELARNNDTPRDDGPHEPRTTRR